MNRGNGTPGKRERRSPPTNDSNKPDSKVHKANNQFEVLWSATSNKEGKLEGTRKPKKSSRKSSRRKTTVGSSRRSSSANGRRTLTPLKRRNLFQDLQSSILPNKNGKESEKPSRFTKVTGFFHNTLRSNDHVDLSHLPSDSSNEDQSSDSSVDNLFEDNNLRNRKKKAIDLKEESESEDDESNSSGKNGKGKNENMEERNDDKEESNSAIKNGKVASQSKEERNNGGDGESNSSSKNGKVKNENMEEKNEDEKESNSSTKDGKVASKRKEERNNGDDGYKGPMQYEDGSTNMHAENDSKSSIKYEESSEDLNNALTIKNTQENKEEDSNPKTSNKPEPLIVPPDDNVDESHSIPPQEDSNIDNLDNHTNNVHGRTSFNVDDQGNEEDNMDTVMSDETRVGNNIGNQEVLPRWIRFRLVVNIPNIPPSILAKKQRGKAVAPEYQNNDLRLHKIMKEFFSHVLTFDDKAMVLEWADQDNGNTEGIFLPDSLPTAESELVKFFKGFKGKDQGPVYILLRIVTRFSDEDFHTNCQSWLKANQSTLLRCPVQTEESTDIAWLGYTSQYNNKKYIAQQLSKAVGHEIGLKLGAVANQAEHNIEWKKKTKGLIIVAPSEHVVTARNKLQAIFQEKKAKFQDAIAKKYDIFQSLMFLPLENDIARMPNCKKNFSICLQRHQVHYKSICT